MVGLPGDEFLARPIIIAWLAYPSHERFRLRAVKAMQDYARFRLGLQLAGRKARVEKSLRRVETELDRQLLAGEIFRRQLLVRARSSNSQTFSRSSTKAFAEWVAERANPANPQRENATRDYWSKRRPALALAIGVCEGLSRRPDMTRLLFNKRPWALRSITSAEAWRLRAMAVNHPLASELIRFSSAAHF